MSILSSRYRSLLELCHKRLTGDLEITNKEIVKQTGYDNNFVASTIYQIRHACLSGEAKVYVEQKFPDTKPEDYRVRVKPISEDRKGLLRICYQTHIGDLGLSFKEIAEITGFPVEAVRSILNNLKNDKLPVSSAEYLKGEFPDYDERLRSVKAIKQPISQDTEFIVNKLKREEQKSQALELAEKLQASLIKMGKWDDATYDYVDAIHRQIIKTESLCLESALVEDRSSEHLKKCMEQFEFQTDIYNMALNILNQKIEIRDETKLGEFTEHSEFTFCSAYSSIADMRSKFGTLSTDEQTDVTPSTPEPTELQKTYTLPQEGI